MFQAIAQFFNALFTIFQAVERGAKAVDYVAASAETTAYFFNERAAEDAKARHERLKAELARKRAELPSLSTIDAEAA